MTSVNFKDDTMDIALRFGMMLIYTCASAGMIRKNSASLSRTGHIWVPDGTMYKLKKVERVKVFQPTGHFLVEKWNNTTMVHFSMDLRATLICAFDSASFHLT